MGDRLSNARRRGGRGGSSVTAGYRGAASAAAGYDFPDPDRQPCKVCGMRAPHHKWMCPRAKVHYVWDRDAGHGSEGEHLGNDKAAALGESLIRIGNLWGSS